MKFNVDFEKCTGCASCVKDCVMRILEIKDAKAHIRAGKEAFCIGCQHCLAICPEGAVTLGGVKPEDCKPSADLDLPSGDQLSDLLISRRSIRQYLPENVDKALIKKLLDLAANIPTGCNSMDLTFYVVDDKDKLSGLRHKIMQTMQAHEKPLSPMLAGAVQVYEKNPANDELFRGAPHILIVAGKKNAPTPQTDCDAAIAYFDLLAQAHGLGTTWCGYLVMVTAEVPEVYDLLGLERGTPYYAMLFGKPAVEYSRTVNRSSAARTVYL